MSFTVDLDNTRQPTETDVAIVVVNGQIYHPSSQQLWLPVVDLPEWITREAHLHFIGMWRDSACFVAALSDVNSPITHWSSASLRALMLNDEDGVFPMASRAAQLSHWLLDHAYCGRCGQPTSLHPVDRAFGCDACNALYYPRISPCVIGLVHRDGALLLARHARSRSGVFSVLAGFIEPSETAEEAFKREVKEEVDIEIATPEDQLSQAWPFPSQLMLGYFAAYQSGDIQVDGDEIVEADWFLPNALPPTPPAETISGQLIRRFIELQG